MKKIPAYIILAIGAAMMLYGAMRGEATDVFRKASAVCLECIGIG